MPRDPIAPPSWTPPDAGSQAGSDETLPRWLTIAGTMAAVGLLLVLLRFAIDLLGLVLVLVLVGFSIRALSDWLSDDDSVSGWALVAVAFSLLGTIAIGTWLFDVKHIDPSGAIQRRLPPTITRAIDWAERRGWGQRVLLSDRSFVHPAPQAASSTSNRPTPSLAIEIPAPDAPRSRGARTQRSRPSTPTATASGSGSSGRTGAGAPGARAGSVAAGAARSQMQPRPQGGPARGAAAGTGAEPVAALPPARKETRTVLTSSPPSARVGTSVRLTVRVEADDGPPGGTVVFRRGNQVLGSARLRPEGDRASAFVIVLSLPVGMHEIVADYGGDEIHAPSRSAPVRQAVVRR